MSKAPIQGLRTLLLLHGPAINSSRKKLIEIKQKFTTKGGTESVITFEKGSEVSEILANLQTISMFDGEKLIIAENPPEEIIPSASLLQSSATIVFWFDHELKKPPEIKDIEIFFFPEEKEASIFPFLDSLGQRSTRAYLELEKRNKTSPDDTQYILTMVFYLLRSLVTTPNSAKDFMKQKNARMRKNFSQEELVSLYKFVLETDFKIKSGLLETNQAEFLLVNLFAH